MQFAALSEAHGCALNCAAAMDARRATAVGAEHAPKSPARARWHGVLFSRIKSSSRASASTDAAKCRVSSPRAMQEQSQCQRSPSCEPRPSNRHPRRHEGEPESGDRQPATQAWRTRRRTARGSSTPSPASAPGLKPPGDGFHRRELRRVRHGGGEQALDMEIYTAFRGDGRLAARLPRGVRDQRRAVCRGAAGHLQENARDVIEQVLAPTTSPRSRR